MYEVPYGNSVKLKCIVKTNGKFPVKNINWHFNNTGVITTINSSTQGIAGSSLKNPSLSILFATTSESGVYTCLATNTIATGTSSPIIMSVIGGKNFFFVTEYTIVTLNQQG